MKRKRLPSIITFTVSDNHLVVTKIRAIAARAMYVSHGTPLALAASNFLKREHLRFEAIATI
jgi:hypothetical protein